MDTGRGRGKSLAPLSKKAGEDKRRQLKELKTAALKHKDDGKS